MRFRTILIAILLVIQSASLCPTRADVVPTQDIVKVLSILAVLPDGGRRITGMTDEAEKLYEHYKKAVYQIRVINLASGKKSVIGSAFQFTTEGHIATNFHVVSEAVHAPSRFKIELLRWDGTVVEAMIRAVDVIHDLAVLRIKDGYTIHLAFGSSDLSKGSRVFAMGNPHDLGMSIVEGTYNGLLEKSMYRKIHFSGALNGGMSGGPALDHKGRVIGVNVSTYGNQVSFFVPVEYLKDLFASIKEGTDAVLDWKNIIQEQLILNQTQQMDSILRADWETLPIGDSNVPGEMTELFKCWGDSKDSGEELYEWASLRCSSQDEIFISNQLSTGRVMYNYVWVKSRGLNPFRFYRVYEYWFSQPFNFDNANEEDVTKFKCRSGFVRIAGEAWKTIVCARRYKKFPKLFDVNLNMATVSHYSKGLLSEMVALGVTQERSQELMRKFMENIRWNK